MIASKPAATHATLATVEEALQTQISPDADLDRAARALQAIKAGAVVVLQGRTPLSQYLIESGQLPVCAVLDQMIAPGQSLEWHGLPVVSSVEKLTKTFRMSAYVIISCVFRTFAKLARQRLTHEINHQALPCMMVEYADLRALEPCRFQPLAFMHEMQRALTLRFDIWKRNYLGWSDANSRNTYAAVTLARLTADLNYIGSVARPTADQYFDQRLKLPARPSFLDGGSFDGMTAKAFARAHPDHGQIWLIEASPTNALRLATTSLEQTAVVACALDRCCGVTSFIDGFGPSSWIPTSEFVRSEMMCRASNDDPKESHPAISIQVQTQTIDEIVAGKPVSWIKLDIEGSEQRALEGAARTITKDTPALAIAAYHYATQLIDVPFMVQTLRPSTRYYLAHYTSGLEETIAYASFG